MVLPQKLHLIKEKAQLDEKCWDLTLPLKPKDPIKCWPCIIIIASHPINGSGLSRDLLSSATGGLNYRVMQYNQPRTTSFYKVNDKLMIYGQSKRKAPSRRIIEAPLAMAGKPLFLKSHKLLSKPENTEKSNVFFRGTNQQVMKQEGGHVNAVVRLARNPGDQIFRNLFRWRKIYIVEEGNLIVNLRKAINFVDQKR